MIRLYLFFLQKRRTLSTVRTEVYFDCTRTNQGAFLFPKITTTMRATRAGLSFSAYMADKEEPDHDPAVYEERRSVSVSTESPISRP